MQGAGARLRKNIEVTRTPLTWGMRTAVRRVPDAMLRRSKKQQRRKRQCISCNDDISKRPVSHTQCYGCWTSGHRATRGEDDDEEYEGESEGESDDT